MTGERVAGCMFCASLARFGPNRGQPTLAHRHEVVEGRLRPVTDDATALNGQRATGYYDEDQRMWLAMPTGGAL